MKIEIVNLYKYWKLQHLHLMLFGYEGYKNRNDDEYKRLLDSGYINVMRITILNIIIIIRWGK